MPRWLQTSKLIKEKLELVIRGLVVFDLFLFFWVKKNVWLTLVSMMLYFIVAAIDQSSGRLLFAKYSLIWAAGTFVFYVLAAHVKIFSESGYPRFLKYLA